MITVEAIQQKCEKKKRTLVTYISMGFGNPYGDAYDVGIVEEFSEKLSALGITIISLADTIGVSTSGQITYLFKTLVARFPEIEFGAHLHSNPATATEKISAAWQAGCQRFDGAIKGFGGCPMAEDELVGNIATENIIAYLTERGINLELDQTHFSKALTLAEEIFPVNHS